MNPEQYVDLKHAAAALHDETLRKIAQAERVIKEANALSESVARQKNDLKKRIEALDLKEKKLKYAELRIVKYMNDKNFDAVFKAEIQQLMAG